MPNLVKTLTLADAKAMVGAGDVQDIDVAMAAISVLRNGSHLPSELD